VAKSGQQAGKAEAHTADQDEDAPLPDIAEDANRGFDKVAEDAWYAEENTDLCVGQAQIRSDERPCSIFCAEYEFVEEFDQQQNDDEGYRRAEVERPAFGG